MSRSGPIAFLFPAFPNLHQTFVLWEVLALRRRGIDIALYSIKPPVTRTQQPEGAELQREVTYLPSTLAPAVLAANLAMLARAPGRYLRACVGVVRGWWQDRAAGRAWQRARISDDAPDRELTWIEYLRGRFNRSPFLYLLKSLWLIPGAVWLGRDLQARGITRLHAHWASYSATMALVVHWLFDIPFSFTAHAYDIYLVPRLLGVKVREAEFAVTCARVNAEFLRTLGGAGGGRARGGELSRREPRPLSTDGAAAPRRSAVRGHLRAARALQGPPRAAAGAGRADPAGALRRGRRRPAARAPRAAGARSRHRRAGGVHRPRAAEPAGGDLCAGRSVRARQRHSRALRQTRRHPERARRSDGDADGGRRDEHRRRSGVDCRRRARPPRAAERSGRTRPAIDELLADEPQRQRLARAAVERVRTIFDREINIEELAALFRRAGASRSAAAG